MASPASTSNGCFVSCVLLKTKATTASGWPPTKSWMGGVSQGEWMEVCALTSQHAVPSSLKPPQRLPGNGCFRLWQHWQTLGKHLPLLLLTDTYILPPHVLILSAFNFQQAQKCAEVHWNQPFHKEVLMALSLKLSWTHNLFQDIWIFLFKWILAWNYSSQSTWLKFLLAFWKGLIILGSPAQSPVGMHLSNSNAWDQDLLEGTVVPVVPWEASQARRHPQSVCISWKQKP